MQKFFQKVDNKIMLPSKTHHLASLSKEDNPIMHHKILVKKTLHKMVDEVINYNETNKHEQPEPLCFVTL